MMLKTFFKDNSAIEGMPMRIAVTMIIFSVILGISAKAALNFADDAKEKKLIHELDLIEKRASMMYAQGGAREINDPGDISGSRENIHVKIPDNVIYAVFGSLPASEGGPPGTRDIHTDNVYYYVLDNGRVQTGSSNARFSANDTGLSTPFLLYPGEYELTLELVKNKNGTYVKIE